MEVHLSEKGADADRFLEDLIAREQPVLCFIDAPLSLPAAYFGASDDYFYRQVDRDLGAMSPMFLGGLTARAMRLVHRHHGIRFMETYPKKVVQLLGLQTHYKKDPEAFISELSGWLPLEVPAGRMNWHSIDAVLAWLSGWRYARQQATCYGNRKEGEVWI